MTFHDQWQWAGRLIDCWELRCEPWESKPAAPLAGAQLLVALWTRLPGAEPPPLRGLTAGRAPRRLGDGKASGDCPAQAGIRLQLRPPVGRKRWLPRALAGMCLPVGRTRSHAARTAPRTRGYAPHCDRQMGERASLPASAGIDLGPKGSGGCARSAGPACAGMVRTRTRHGRSWRAPLWRGWADPVGSEEPPDWHTRTRGNMPRLQQRCGNPFANAIAAAVDGQGTVGTGGMPELAGFAKGGPARVRGPRKA